MALQFCPVVQNSVHLMMHARFVTSLARLLNVDNEEREEETFDLRGLEPHLQQTRQEANCGFNFRKRKETFQNCRGAHQQSDHGKDLKSIMCHAHMMFPFKGRSWLP